MEKYRCNYDELERFGKGYYIPISINEGWLVPGEYCVVIGYVGGKTQLEFDNGSRIILSDEYLQKYFIECD